MNFFTKSHIYLEQIMPEKKVVKENIRLHEKAAENYEDKNPDIFNEREEKRVKSVLDEAQGHISTKSSESRALDVGCGTGNILRKLKSRFDRVVGVDVSDDMLSKAFPTAKRREDVKLVRGRVADLPFWDNYFDLVTAYSVFHHLPNFSEPLSEIARVLKGGGVLYIDHEPIERERLSVKLYMKFCDILNGEAREGLPPYEETGGLDREFTDYHIHHGDVEGIKTSRIKDICEDLGLNITTTREYLSYGTERKNFLHPVFRPFANNEWLLIGRKEG